MNRGLSRRVIFDRFEEAERFLALVAKAVELGELEVHCYSLLTTHFHMLVRSPRGELSKALYRIEKDYVRWYNHRYGRDGPLFKGRFTSKRVDCEVYWEVLIRYIDFNPVLAGLVARPADHLLGSARYWAMNTFPDWLSTYAIRERLRLRPGDVVSRAYEEVFGRPLSRSAHDSIDHRIARPCVSEDPLPGLLGAAPGVVLEWLRANTRLADGSSLDHPLVGREAAKIVIGRIRDEVDEQVEVRGQYTPAGCLEAMALRTLCRLSLEEAGVLVGVGRETVRRRFQRHAELLQQDDYAAWATTVVRSAIRDLVES